MMHNGKTMNQASYDSLTPMERNCLRLAHHACKAEQIAHQLGIKSSTVNAHIYSARKKLGGISRLSAADELRRHEAESSRNDQEQIENTRVEEAFSLPNPTLSEPHQSISRQPMGMVHHVEGTAEMPHPAEVREQRTLFVYDDAGFHAAGGQDQARDAALRRLVMILVIAALAALILIAAPAIYDSTAQRIANSLERPHE
jgi:DNA-binding CsgD family transcriptional regulator